MNRRRAVHVNHSNYPHEVDRHTPMSATPTEEQLQDVQASATEEANQDAAAAVASVDEAFEAAEDLGIPEDVPTADDPGSRASSRSSGSQA